MCAGIVRQSMSGAVKRRLSSPPSLTEVQSPKMTLKKLLRLSIIIWGIPSGCSQASPKLYCNCKNTNEELETNIQYQAFEPPPRSPTGKEHQGPLTMNIIGGVRPRIRRSPENKKEVKEVQPSGNDEIQNNVDTLWTWSINGAKVAGSLVLITGAIKVIQGLLGYWRDEVLTWWDRMKRRWATLSTDEVSSDEE